MCRKKTIRAHPPDLLLKTEIRVGPRKLVSIWVLVVQTESDPKATTGDNLPAQVPLVVLMRNKV